MITNVSGIDIYHLFKILNLSLLSPCSDNRGTCVLMFKSVQVCLGKCN